MIEKIKEIFKANNEGYKPYNMIICTNSLHNNICNCQCHKNKGSMHITACCHLKVCPDCQKELRIKN